jgi:signal transduction histidine kinase
MDRVPVTAAFEGNDFHFYGDRDKLKIVLRNLLTNAIESIQKTGEISVQIKSDSQQITLEINDTGSGIEEEIISRLFEPYFSTKDAGTGLGLPIAKKIITDHKGEISASSNHPHGMRFLIKLPRQPRNS